VGKVEGGRGRDEREGRTSKGDVSKGALEGHEGGKGHDLLEIDVGGVSDATLDGETMHAVLGAVCRDGIVATVVVLDLELDAEDVLALLHRVEGVLGKAGELGGLVEERLEALEERRLAIVVRRETSDGRSKCPPFFFFFLWRL